MKTITLFMRCLSEEYRQKTTIKFNEDLKCSKSIMNGSNKHLFTSISHNALELVAVVADDRAVVLRNTCCCRLYSSAVRNFCSSAWNRRTTSPWGNLTNIFIFYILNWEEIYYRNYLTKRHIWLYKIIKYHPKSWKPSATNLQAV